MANDLPTSQPVLEPDAGERKDKQSVIARRSWNQVWEGLVRLGLGELTLRVGMVLALLALVLLVVWVMGNFFLKSDQITASQPAALAATSPAPQSAIDLPLGEMIVAVPYANGITRLAQIYTILPTRPRFEVFQYEVKLGDSLFTIAEKFNLRPETILWGNYNTLRDTPHSLRPNQKLIILPVNGVYHEWRAGEGLTAVAKFYGVKPEDILNYPGNHLNAETIGDLAKPNIEPGTMLIIPGGKRDFVTWSVPRVSRTNPAAAKVIGPGYCGNITSGPVGNGTFVWPAVMKWLSGTDYAPQANHPAIDIAGGLGTAIYATDAGVVVYAGWNDWGYGNLIILDHGNGWQSIYGHLHEVRVGCGQGVKQGEIIGTLGSTGNSTGPHLHFELLHEQYGKVNPHLFLIK